MSLHAVAGRVLEAAGFTHRGDTARATSRRPVASSSSPELATNTYAQLRPERRRFAPGGVGVRQQRCRGGFTPCAGVRGRSP
jgi:hypothetical protein